MNDINDNTNFDDIEELDSTWIQDFDNLDKETITTITNDLNGITSFNEAVKAQATTFIP